MENPTFIDDFHYTWFPVKTSIYRGFPVAMFDWRISGATSDVEDEMMSVRCSPGLVWLKDTPTMGHKHWLVGQGHPSEKNMSSSIGMMTFPILMGKYGKIKKWHPNHQPVIILHVSLILFCECSQMNEGSDFSNLQCMDHGHPHCSGPPCSAQSSSSFWPASAIPSQSVHSNLWERDGWPPELHNCNGKCFIPTTSCSSTSPCGSMWIIFLDVYVQA